MIFLALQDSAQRGELILIEGGYCRWRMRKDGQITILEIISLRKGAGSEMLEMLKKEGKKKKAYSIFAKCPAILPANEWYKKRGFVSEGEEKVRSGSIVYLWRLELRKKFLVIKY